MAGVIDKNDADAEFSDDGSGGKGGKTEVAVSNLADERPGSVAFFCGGPDWKYHKDIINYSGEMREGQVAPQRGQW